MLPITTEREALDVLENVILGLACTEAYHDGDTETLLKMAESDVKRYLVEQLEFIPNTPSTRTTREASYDNPGIHQLSRQGNRKVPHSYLGRSPAGDGRA